MKPPTAVELLAVWEQGAAQRPIDRALTVLSMAYPEDSFAQLARMSIGQRDAGLLAVHESLFGSSLPCYAECPACSTPLQFTLNVEDFPQAVHNDGAWEVVTGDVRIRFRPPNSSDLADAARRLDVASARELLLERCILEAERNGCAVPASEIPEAAIGEMSSCLSKTETHADMSLSPECVACGQHWELTLDIASFLWAEINSLAKRHLSEVHALAWAYGWRESDILAMSAVRRQFYLDRLQ
jgi:hypothetical protein